MSKHETFSSLPNDIITLTNSLTETENEELKYRLIVLINELIRVDFNRLVQLLYQVDINESKLKQVLTNGPEVDTAPIIADLIIKRQWEKIQSKKKYRQSHHEESTEEKW